jgi:hypothetical protein
MSMVGTDGMRSLEGRLDRGSDLKRVGYKGFSQNPMYMVNPAATHLNSAPSVAPLAAVVLFALGVELQLP